LPVFPRDGRSAALSPNRVPKRTQKGKIMKKWLIRILVVAGVDIATWLVGVVGAGRFTA